MNELTLITTERFGELDCNFYESGKEYVVTREQISAALGYANADGIARIHNRHKERFVKFSTVVNLTTVEGNRNVARNTIVYTRRGIMEICRWSRQPKADAFMDFCWDVMERLMKGEATQPDARIETLTEEVRKLTESIAIIAGQFAKPTLQVLQTTDSTIPGKAARRRWMRTLNEKLDLLEEKFKASRNEILHKVYVFVEQNFDIILDEERIKAMEQKGLSDCTVLEVIFYDENYRTFMQNTIDCNLDPEDRGW